MTAEALLIWLIVGAIAGWLAGLIVKGYGFGLVGNVILGIVGALLGGWLFAQLNIVIMPGIIGTIIAATVGAIVLLLLVRVLRRV